LTVGTLEVADDLHRLLARGAELLEERGDLPESKRWFDAAITAADRSDDAQAWVLAVLGSGGLWVHEQRTAAGFGQFQARIRRALQLVDPTSPVGLRLRARAAGEADYRNGDVTTIMSILQEARALGDPVTTAEVINIALHCLLGPDHGGRRLALAEELIEQAALTTRRVDQLLGLLWQSIGLLLVADPHAGRRLNELRAALTHGEHLAIGFVAEAIEVMLAIRAGRLDEAEEMAQACATRGAAAGNADAVGWHAAQMVAIRWYQGRVGELTPMLSDLVHSPDLSVVDNSLFAALAVAAASAGDRRTAASALATLTGRDLDDLPKSSTWLVMMSGVVEAAHLLGDADTASRAYDLLVPHANLPMIVGAGAACYGSTHHALGVASFTVGDLDVAVRHMKVAVRHNLALAHWPAVSAARIRYAEVLDRRDGPGDAAEAAVQRSAVADEGVNAGNPPSRPSASRAPGGRVATCTPNGQRWRIEWDNRTVLVDDSVGMLYVATLLNNPGRSIPSIDLVAGFDTFHARAATTSAQPMLDRAAVAQYRERLAQISMEIDECELVGDQERAARARVEQDWLTSELSAATGISGLSRNFPDDTERARSAVGKAIRRVLTRVERADPKVGQYLRETVRTGTVCSYRPNET
jgi:hypothetical protein